MLEELGYAPGAQGYEVLRNDYGGGMTSPTPRTIRKMLNEGSLVRWSTCGSVVQLLNKARESKALDLLPNTVIAGYEHYIANFDEVLLRVKRQHGLQRDAARAAIASKAGFTVELIKLLVKKRTALESQCETVRDAVKALWGFELSVSNKPFVIVSNTKVKIPRKRRARTIAPVSLPFR